MASDEEDMPQEEGEEGEEEGGEGEKEVEETQPVYNPLTRDIAGEGLSLLCKTGNGLAHAYVRMDVKNMNLTDISLLSKYIHIRYLDLSGNKLTDISPITALNHLLTLNVNNNKLTSARLEEMPYLQVASFSNNDITSAEGIAHPLLEVLSLSSNKITELSGITRQSLPSLRSLDLHNNQLTSLEGLATPTLQKLYVASNAITSTAGLTGLPQLTHLHMRENKVTALDSLSPELESLQYINLRDNLVPDLEQVEKLVCLPFLRVLVLQGCPVSDIDDYRVEVLVRLRTLERIDKDPYTDDERQDAEEIYAQRKLDEQNKLNKEEEEAA